MNKKDLIKCINESLEECINESLEESLPENLEYNFPSVQITAGLVVDKNSTIGNIKIIRKEFEIKVDLIEHIVGNLEKGLKEIKNKLKEIT